MKFINFILINFCIVLFFYFHSNTLYSQSSESVQLFKAGVDAEQSEKYDEAIAYYSLAITLEPNYYEVYIHRGEVYRRIKNYYRAIRDYTKLLMLKNNSGNYLNRAKVYIEMNATNSALSDLTKSIQLNDKSYDAYYTRGIVYYNKLEYDSSTADLLKCIELRPDYKDAKEKLASLLKNEGKTDEQPVASSDQSRKEIKSVDRFKDGELHKEPEKQEFSDSTVTENITSGNSITQNKDVSTTPTDKTGQLQISENIVDKKSNDGFKKEPDKGNESIIPNVGKNKVDEPISEIKEDIKQPVLEIKEEIRQPNVQVDKDAKPQISENIISAKSNDTISNVPDMQNESGMPVAENKKIENSKIEIKEELKEPVTQTDKTQSPQISENTVQEKTIDNVSKISDQQVKTDTPVIDNNSVKENKEDIKEPVTQMNEQPQISENIVQEKTNNTIPKVTDEVTKPDMPVIENSPVKENKEDIKEPVTQVNEQPQISENIVPEKPNDSFSNQSGVQNESNIQVNGDSNIQETKNDESTPSQEKMEQQPPVKNEIAENLVQPDLSQNKISDAVSLQKNEETTKIENQELVTRTPRPNVKNYSIQLGAFANEINAREFLKKVKSTFEYEINSMEISGLFKVRTENYQLDEALDIIKKIREAGFTDAFLVDLSK